MWSAPVVLACALNLLGRTTDIPPIELVPVPPDGVSRLAEAFTREDSNIIYVVMSSAVFRTAQHGQVECGDLESLRKLASIIVHEAWHVRHGSDEQDERPRCDFTFSQSFDRGCSQAPVCSQQFQLM